MKNNMLKAFLKKTGILLLNLTMLVNFVPASVMNAYAVTGDTIAEDKDSSEEEDETDELSEQDGDAEKDDEDHPYETVTISDEDQLVDYLLKCTSDSFSRYTIVELTADIKLTSNDFEPAQIFAGIFHGNDHEISAVYHTGGGYADGFFRYLTEDADIEDLNISGHFEAENDKVMTGGIAGVNSGTINNCTFVGIVNGKSETGGIAGENETTGIISNSSAFGSITGYNMAGGIAGANYGQIVSCTNEAGINADSSWVNESDANGYSWITDSIEDNKLVSGTDIGGIAGLSHGIIINCTNKATVGYNHNGYNIGGIAGRQSGQIIYCENKGEVYGRKDVGGIVGQMEPYISIEDAESISEATQDLHDQVDNFLDDAGNTSDDLTDDIDSLRSYSDSAVDSAHDITDGVTDFVDSNVEAVGRLSNKVDYLADQMPDILADTMAAVSEMKVASEDFRKVSSTLAAYGTAVNNDYNAQYSVTNNTITTVTSAGGYVNVSSSAPDAGSTVTITLSPKGGYEADTSYGDGGAWVEDSDGNHITATADPTDSNKFTFTMPDGGKTVTVYGKFKRSDSAKTNGINTNYSDVYVESTIGGNASCSANSDNTATVIKYTVIIEPESGFEVSSVKLYGDAGVGGSESDITAEAGRLTQDNTLQYTVDVSDYSSTGGTTVTLPAKVDITFAKSAGAASGGSSTQMTGYISTDVATLQSQMNEVNDTATQLEQYFSDGTQYSDLSEAQKSEVNTLAYKLISQTSEAASTASAVAGELTQAESLIAGDTSTALNTTNAELQVVITDLEVVFDSLNSAFNKTKSAFSYANSMPDASFSQLDSGTKQSVNDLYSQLGSISSATGVLTSNLSSNSDVLESDLRGINDQVNKIMQLFSSMIEDAEDLYNDQSLYEDVSDELIDETSDGKVSACTNKGSITGDIDVGGIAGSMAIDEEDPEGNAAGDVTYTLGARYLTKCIIQSCVNNADVTSKKDGVGGIAGYMNLGIVSGSEAYGSIESTEGSYVGGISGQSLALIRDSYALADLHGTQYVGGIAGTGSKISGCDSLVTIDDTSAQCGAIAGMIEMEEGERFDYYDNITDNYFVSDSIGGIDGMSLDGIAQQITYQQMIESEGIPTKFRHLTIKYVANGDEVNVQEVPYGTELKYIDPPQAPNLDDGTFGVWPDVSDRKMEVNMVLEAEYEDNITTLESEDKDSTSGKNYVYVDGVYTDQAEVVVNTEEDDEKNTITYTIYIDGTTIPSDETSKVRLYNPFDKIKEVEKKTDDGKWEKVEYKEYGSYLQVEMPGMDAIYRVTGKEPVSKMVYIIGGAAAAVILLIGMTHVIHRKKKKNKNSAGNDKKNKKAGKAKEKSEKIKNK